MFTSHTTESERLTSANYDVAKLIAVYKKPFPKGEYVKECIMAVIQIVDLLRLKHIDQCKF